MLPSLKDAISNGLRATFEPLTVALEIPPPQISDFKEFSNKSTSTKDGSITTTDIQFTSRPFVYHPAIQDIAVYVGEEGLLAAAIVRNLPQPAPKPGKPAPVADYPRVKPADADAAYATYKAAFLKAFEAAYGRKVADAANLAITKPYVTQTLRELAGGAPIGAKVVVDNETTINSDIKLVSEVDLKCGDKLNTCSYKDVCASSHPCQEITKVPQQKLIEKFCERLECVVPRPFGGCLVQNPIKFHCDETVTEWVDKVNDISSPLCDGFRNVAKGVPGFCQTANNLTKAQCDVFAAHDTIACQAEQEFNNALARNPFAEVHGFAVIKGAVDASAANFTIAEDFYKVSVSLSAKGNAHIDTHIDLKMKERTPVPAVCNPTWTGNPQADVSIDVKDLVFDFILQSHEVRNDRLKLAFETPDEKEIKINLSQSPIEVIHTATDGATICCDRVGVPLKLVSVAMSLDPALRGIEALTRKLDIPQKLSKQKFGVELPGFDLKMGADTHKLAPSWGDKVVGFNLK